MIRKKVIKSNAPCTVTKNGILFSLKTVEAQTPTEPITIWMETVEVEE